MQKDDWVTGEMRTNSTLGKLRSQQSSVKDPQFSRRIPYRYATHNPYIFAGTHWLHLQGVREQMVRPSTGRRLHVQFFNSI